jgi:hypothetical protein
MRAGWIGIGYDVPEVIKLLRSFNAVASVMGQLAP